MKKCFVLVFVVAILVVISRTSSADSATDLCQMLGFNDNHVCLNSPQVAAFKCDQISSAPDYWAKGLKPSMSMVVCNVRHKRGEGAGGIKETGCMMPISMTLLVAGADKKIRHLKDKEAFKEIFLPIEDADEAIGYVGVLEKASPMYHFPKDYQQWSGNKEPGKWLDKKLKPTRAEKKDDGWHVWMFYQPICGCHKMELFENEYVIDAEGAINKLKSRPVWRNEVEICVD